MQGSCLKRGFVQIASLSKHVVWMEHSVWFKKKIQIAQLTDIPKADLNQRL